MLRKERGVYVCVCVCVAGVVSRVSSILFSEGEVRWRAKGGRG